MPFSGFHVLPLTSRPAVTLSAALLAASVCLAAGPRAVAAVRTDASDASAFFNPFPDTNRLVRTGDTLVLTGAGAGASIILTDNQPGLTIGTGVSGSNINGNAIAFSLPANGVPALFNVASPAGTATNLNLAGNVVNNTGVSQTLGVNLIETGIPKANNVYGYLFNSGAGGLLLQGTVGTGTLAAPGTTADFRKYGAGLLVLDQPAAGGNNVGTSTFPVIGSLVDAFFVDAGTVNLKPGVTVDARAFSSIGYLPGETGALTINGTLNGQDALNVADQVNTVGSVTLNAGGTVNVVTAFPGKSGNGTLTLNGGSFLLSGYSSVGTFGGSQGTFNLNGGDYSCPNDFNVADATGAVGTLNLSGGTIEAITVYVGKGSGNNGAGTVGSVNQTGGVFSRATSGTVNGDGEWRIGGGLSGNPAAKGTYTMQGGSLETSSNFQVGAFGIGTLTQTGGTLVLDGYVDSGRFPGGTGLIAVTGGTFTQTGNAYRFLVGEGGTGVLTVGSTPGANASRGLVVSRGGLVLAPNSGSVGTVNLNVGGTLQASSVGGDFDQGAGNGALGTSTFNFNGGTLVVDDSNPSFDGTTYFQRLTTANVQVGGAFIDTGNDTVTVAQNLNHDASPNAAALDGGLTKLGAGTLILPAVNTYTGPTTLSAGILQIAADSALGAGAVVIGANSQLSLSDNFVTSRAIAVNAGGFLSGGGTVGLTLNGGPLTGSGTVNASVQLNNGASLTGPLTINGALTVQDGGVVSLTGGTLTVNGTLTNNGVLRFEHGAALVVNGNAGFVNNGTLDLITGSFTPPAAGFTNHGVVLDGTVNRVKSISRNPGNNSVTVTVTAYPGHTYQLQRAAGLAPNAYSNLPGVPAQTNPATSAGAVTYSFTDSAPQSGQGFYRVQVDP